MDQQIKEQLLKYLSAILTNLEKGAGFVMEQAPEVVREYIILARVDNTFWFALGVLLVTVALRVAFWRALPKLLQLCEEDRGSENVKRRCVRESEYVPAMVQLVTSGFALIIGFITAAEHASPMIKAWFAPRILVIEWIKSLL